MSKQSPLPSFWTSLKNSFYNPAFYSKVPAFPFGKVMGYLLLVVLLGGVLFLAEGAGALWLNREKIDQGIDKVLSSYPEDLELTFADGKLSSNVQEPYFFPEGGIAEAFKDQGEVKLEDDAPQYFVVIDTATPFSAEQFESYDSIVWLGKDTAYVMDDNQGMRVFPYDKDLDSVINATTVREFGLTLLSKLKVPFILAGLILLALVFLGIFLFYAVYLLLAALLYFFFSQVAGKKREYPEAYRIVVYAFTPVFALSILIHFVSLFAPLQMPPFLFTAILLLTVYLNTRPLASQTKS